MFNILKFSLLGYIHQRNKIFSVCLPEQGAHLLLDGSDVSSWNHYLCKLCMWLLNILRLCHDIMLTLLVNCKKHFGI